jgi:hypothetical protein
VYTATKHMWSSRRKKQSSNAASISWMHCCRAVR